MSLVIVLLNFHALRRRGVLALNQAEVFLTKADLGAWGIVGGVGLLSIILAILTPPTSFGLPGWIYMSLAIIMPIYGILTGRRAKLIQQSSGR